MRVLVAQGPCRLEHLEGWTLHVNERLFADEPKATADALDILQKQLAEIVRVVPEPALGHLREVPLWLSPEYPNTRPGAEYHQEGSWLRDHGRNPEMVRSVEFTNIRIFANAMNNAFEYFAETTEAFFGRNDFFPFTRAELRSHDPGMEALLAKVWGVGE